MEEQQGLERQQRCDYSRRRSTRRAAAASSSSRRRGLVMAASGGAVIVGVVIVLATASIDPFSAWTTTSTAPASATSRRHDLFGRRTTIRGESRAGASYSSSATPTLLRKDVMMIRPHLRQRMMEPSFDDVVDSAPPADGRSSSTRRLASSAREVDVKDSASPSRAITGMLSDLWHRHLARTKARSDSDGSDDVNATRSANHSNGTRNRNNNNNGTRAHQHASRDNVTATISATVENATNSTSGSSRSSNNNNTNATNASTAVDESNATATTERDPEPTGTDQDPEGGNPVPEDESDPNDALTTTAEMEPGSVDTRVEHGDEDEEDEDHDTAESGTGTSTNSSGTDDKHGTSAGDKKDIQPSDSTETPQSAGKSTDDAVKKEEAELEKAEQELQAEETKVRRVSGFGAALGIFAMIFTAWQISENPDGIYAAMCRLVLTICNLVFRLALAPCHRCCPGWLAPSSSHYRHTYGHVPATLDYGYRDPALELS